MMMLKLTNKNGTGSWWTHDSLEDYRWVDARGAVQESNETIARMYAVATADRALVVCDATSEGLQAKFKWMQEAWIKATMRGYVIAADVEESK